MRPPLGPTPEHRHSRGREEPSWAGPGSHRQEQTTGRQTLLDQEGQAHCFSQTAQGHPQNKAPGGLGRRLEGGAWVPAGPGIVALRLVLISPSPASPPLPPSAWALQLDSLTWPPEGAPGPTWAQSWPSQGNVWHPGLGSGLPRGWLCSPTTGPDLAGPSSVPLRVPWGARPRGPLRSCLISASQSEARRSLPAQRPGGGLAPAL